MTLFGTKLQEKVGTIYNHPTTQYEQFIERYYGRHKGSGKSKATVISDGQAVLLDIRGVMLWGVGFQLNVTMMFFGEKIVWRCPLTIILYMHTLVPRLLPSSFSAGEEPGRSLGKRLYVHFVLAQAIVHFSA